MVGLAGRENKDKEKKSEKRNREQEKKEKDAEDQPLNHTVRHRIRSKENIYRNRGR